MEQQIQSVSMRGALPPHLAPSFKQVGWLNGSDYRRDEGLLVRDVIEPGDDLPVFVGSLQRDVSQSGLLVHLLHSLCGCCRFQVSARTALCTKAWQYTPTVMHG